MRAVTLLPNASVTSSFPATVCSASPSLNARRISDAPCFASATWPGGSVSNERFDGRARLIVGRLHALFKLHGVYPEDAPVALRGLQVKSNGHEQEGL